MKAMEARKGASLTYSRNSEQAAVPKSEVDAPDTGVIKNLSSKTHKLETASQIADYILARRELLSNVFSQYKLGEQTSGEFTGEDYVRSYLIGKLTPKVGIGKAIELFKDDTVRQILSTLRRRMKSVANG